MIYNSMELEVNENKLCPICCKALQLSVSKFKAEGAIVCRMISLSAVHWPFVSWTPSGGTRRVATTFQPPSSTFCRSPVKRNLCSSADRLEPPSSSSQWSSSRNWTPRSTACSPWARRPRAVTPRASTATWCRISREFTWVGQLKATPDVNRFRYWPNSAPQTDFSEKSFDRNGNDFHRRKMMNCSMEYRPLEEHERVEMSTFRYHCSS